MTQRLILAFRISLGLALALQPVLSLAQTPAPKRLPEAKEIEKLDANVRKACDAHFAGISQASSKTTCLLGAILFTEKGKETALNECTKATSKHSRSEMSCRLGVLVASDVAVKADSYSSRLKICQDQYPIRIEADTFLQESCLIGVYLSLDVKVKAGKKVKFDACEQISKDSGFLGPCGAGMSLALDAANSPKAPPSNEQNRACGKYFDPTSFHQGYRACLNARSLALEWDGKASQLARQCKKISGTKGGDTEAAACIVGGGLLHSLQQVPRQENQKLRQCGSSKVSWQDRDFLVCLTAASLLNIGSRNDARGSCKEIFGGRRNHLREDCYRAVDNLIAQGNKPVPTATPGGATSAQKDDDSDLWPDSPDIPEEDSDADEQPAASGSISPNEKPVAVDDDEEAGDREPVSIAPAKN